jgi:hypothetical protein
MTGEWREQFRNYCGLIEIARCGFPWEKTTKRPIASRISCGAALAENNYVRLSSMKVASSSVVPPTSTGNPGSVYTNCETALAVMREGNQRSGQIAVPPSQDMWRNENGKVAHVEFLGCVAERRKAGQFGQAWCAADCIGFLP